MQRAPRALFTGHCLLVTATIAAFFLFGPLPAHGAEECRRTTRISELFLGPTADIRDLGQYEVSAFAGKGDDEANFVPAGITAKYGFQEDWEMHGSYSQKTLPAGVDHALNAGAGWRMICEPGLPTVKLNFGFHHDGGNGMYGGLVAGQELAFGSWQASVTRNEAIYTTTYTAAVTLGRRFAALALEASAQEQSQGWERWASAGFFLVGDSDFGVGLAYTQGGGTADGERFLMARVTAEF